MCTGMLHGLERRRASEHTYVPCTLLKRAWMLPTGHEAPLA